MGPPPVPKKDRLRTSNSRSSDGPTPGAKEAPMIPPRPTPNRQPMSLPSVTERNVNQPIPGPRVSRDRPKVPARNVALPPVIPMRQTSLPIVPSRDASRRRVQPPPLPPRSSAVMDSSAEVFRFDNFERNLPARLVRMPEVVDVEFTRDVIYAHLNQDGEVFSAESSIGREVVEDYPEYHFFGSTGSSGGL